MDVKTKKPREMGGPMARRLEAGAGKPSGWMDTPHHDLDLEHLGTTSRSKDLSGVKKITSGTTKGQVNQTDEDAEFVPSSEIPTTMKFSHPRLHSAVLLLGSLLGALDETSREVIGGLLGKVAKEPDKADTLALRIVRNATLQDRLVSDDALNRRLTQPGAAETNPTPL